MHHSRAKRGELFDALRRAGMVRLDTARFRRKAHRQSDIELLKSAHLPVKPFHGSRAQAV
jgi:hypothetical protein